MRFCLVTEDSIPEETVRLLREACVERSVPFEAVTAKTFDFDPVRRLRAGDLLYRAATSAAAARVEQFLFAPGVATLHSAANGVYFSANMQPLLAEAAAIPLPKTVYLATSEPGLLRRQVERVGGFPVVLKVLGRSSGLGVMLAESMPALRSLADYAIAQGHNPLLCQFIPQAVHWRVIVLGGQAIAHYRNPLPEDDFRSHGSIEREDFAASPPLAVIDAAVRATAAMGFEFAGVDVLEDLAGKAWFLEANFPCYYPHAQLYGGVDIAGAMVDFLLAKADHAPFAQHRGGYAIRRLSTTPDLLIVDGFADAAECEHILARAAAVEREQPPDVAFNRDTTGFSFELPLAGDPVLERISAAVARILGFDNELARSLRFRRYDAGESHPLHLDKYEIAGRALVATAMLYLSDTEAGGETHFPHALPAPLLLQPRRGRLAVWRNHRADGSVDTAALHESLPVSAGSKSTITEFVYRRAAAD